MGNGEGVSLREYEQRLASSGLRLGPPVEMFPRGERFDLAKLKASHPHHVRVDDWVKSLQPPKCLHRPNWHEDPVGSCTFGFKTREAALEFVGSFGGQLLED